MAAGSSTWQVNPPLGTTVPPNPALKSSSTTSTSQCPAAKPTDTSDTLCTGTKSPDASSKSASTHSPPGSPGKSNKDEIQRHWQCIFNLLRPQDRLQMAVRLESCHPGRTRYLVVITTDPSPCATANSSSSCNNTLECIGERIASAPGPGPGTGTGTPAATGPGPGPAVDASTCSSNLSNIANCNKNNGISHSGRHCSSRSSHHHFHNSHRHFATKRNANVVPGSGVSEQSTTTATSTATTTTTGGTVAFASPPIPIPVTSACVHSLMTVEAATNTPVDAVSSFPPFGGNSITNSINSKRKHHHHSRQRFTTPMTASVSRGVNRNSNSNSNNSNTNSNCNCNSNSNNCTNARRIIQESCLLGVDFSYRNGNQFKNDSNDEHKEEVAEGGTTGTFYSHKDGEGSSSSSSTTTTSTAASCSSSASFSFSSPKSNATLTQERASIGLVFPVWADTTINLDGDGGFSVSSGTRQHIFKPISVQAMWSSLQMIHEASSQARSNNFYHGGHSHQWCTYYTNQIDSDRSCLNEWNAMDGLTSKRPLSPDASDEPSEQKATKALIRVKLKEIMTSVDLDEVTSKIIRTRLEEELNMNLIEYKSYIDEEMLTILGQMDTATKIFDYLYLGSEWNASNLEELKHKGVGKILNVTHEIDNFYPGAFEYYNVRVDDDDSTDMLQHWDKTYRYIWTAMKEGSKVLVHCKMGISRSASVVIAYVMKAKNWSLAKSLDFVKGKRSCVKPNENFLKQLEVYQGILSASKQRHNSLWRSKSETNFNSSTSGTSNSSENSSNASSNSSLAASPSSSSEPSSPTQSSVNKTAKHEATGEGQSRSTGCKQVAQLAELFNNNAASHFHHRHRLHNPHRHTSILQIGLSIESLN